MTDKKTEQKYYSFNENIFEEDIGFLGKKRNVAT